MRGGVGAGRLEVFPMRQGVVRKVKCSEWRAGLRGLVVRRVPLDRGGRVDLNS